MLLSESHIIKQSSKQNGSIYKELDNLCFLSKNLYNAGNYIVRQEFINTSKEKEQGLKQNANWIRFNELTKLMNQNPDYIALPRKVSQQTLMNLDRSWTSFFNSIKQWKKDPSNYTGRPKLPKYKHKTKGRYILNYTSQSISKRELKNGYVKLSGTDIKIKYINNQYPLKEVRVIPRNKSYKIEIIYEKNQQQLNLDKNRKIAIDFGVNNLMTITTNQKGLSPILINGRILKSINQYYNKQVAIYQSELPKDKYTSNKIARFTNKRNEKIKYFMHVYSKDVINYCIENNIGVIIAGVNKGWKDEVNIGKVNNQNFVQIPFDKLRSYLKYKAEMVGISYIEQEESYTSKASFLNLDKIPIYKTKKDKEYEFSGYRKSRGVYKIKGKKITINADVNGSYNIMRKESSDVFTDGVEGFVVIPVRYKSPRKV